MGERRTYSGTAGSILLPSEVLTRRQGKGGSVRGVSGLLKWHYFTAAEVKDYQATRDANNRWTLRCRLGTANAYNLAQRPLRFVAPHDKGEWRWPVTAIEIRDGVVTADLGEPLP